MRLSITTKMQLRAKALLLLIPAWCTLVLPAWAEFAQQGSKLVGSDPVGPNTRQGDLGQGLALSADGNTMVVGGSRDSTIPGVGAIGAAWVYTRSNGIWSQQGSKLVGTGSVGLPQQGYSVAISADGNTIVVGGPTDNSGTGAIWIFTRTSGVWSQQGPKLVGSGTVGAATVGTSLALSSDGNTALAGGTQDNIVAGSAYATGAVWVFTRSGGVWTQQGSKLVASNGTSANQGNGVALSGDGNTALVGGPNDSGNVGAAWIYARSGGVWTQGPKLVGTGGTAMALQGYSVALSADGTTAMLGGPGDNISAGASWIFVRSGNGWTQQGAKLLGSLDPNALPNQGYSVALSGNGNTALIGGPRDGATSSGLAGAAWVFARSAGGWKQQGSKLTGSGATGLANQGASVALSADGFTAASAGPADNTNIGAAWVFTQPGIFVQSTHRGNFTQGQNGATYSVTVTNTTGTESSGATTVTETVPSGLTLVSMAGSGWTCPAGGSTCTRSDALAAGASFPPITVAVNVASTAPATVVNAASVPFFATATDSTTIAGPFADVSATDFSFNAVNLMRQYGITGGCQSTPTPLYCPLDNVTRSQMAIFMVRSVLGGDDFTYSTTPYFGDVPANAFGFKWIQKMFELNITAGCGGGNYCPNDPVTRGQMAVFVIRARLGAAADSTFTFPSAPLFTDVPANYAYFKWIQRMKKDQVTAGCGTGTTYCPNDPVTRGQMAIFIIRGAFNQLLPAGTAVLTTANPAAAVLGKSVTLNLAGANTNFSQATTQVSAGPGVTVGTITVASATSLSVQLTIASNATAGPRTLVVTTGVEEAVLPNGLTIQ